MNASATAPQIVVQLLQIIATSVLLLATCMSSLPLHAPAGCLELRCMDRIASMLHGVASRWGARQRTRALAPSCAPAASAATRSIRRAQSRHFFCLCKDENARAPDGLAVCAGGNTVVF